jgi:AraC family transcriptional regulator
MRDECPVTPAVARLAAGAHLVLVVFSVNRSPSTQRFLAVQFDILLGRQGPADTWSRIVFGTVNRANGALAALGAVDANANRAPGPAADFFEAHCYSQTMGLSSNVLAFGAGWRVSDVICTAGPRDLPFEEQHNAVCVAAVTQGTFQYRSIRGSAVLSPGALLLGNFGHCFQCGHEHGTGDRCLSFQLTPDYVEAIVAGSGARQATFSVPNLPPMPSFAPLLAMAEAARDDGDAGEFEELTIALVGAVATALGNAARQTRAPTRQDERRVTDALRLIEVRAEDLEPGLSMTELASEVGMSPFHFLRMFRKIVGLTPYQFVLHTRLHRAAVRLRRSQEAVSSIALEAGFGDLSTFNRRFRRVMGLSPSAYRVRKRPLD